MSPEYARKLIATALVVGGVVTGVWIFVGAPAQARLSAAEQRLTLARRALHEAGSTTPHGFRGDPNAPETRAFEIESKNSASASPLRIYDTVLDLAREFDVSVDRMDPSSPRGAGVDEAVTAYAFEIQTLSTLENLLRFLDAIETNAGHARITSVTTEPRVVDEARLVTAIIRSHHLRFDLGDAIALAEDGAAP